VRRPWACPTRSLDRAVLPVHDPVAIRVRLALAFLFYVFHQWSYWFIGSSLLGQRLTFSFWETLALGVVNALAAVPLYHILDKLKVDQ